MMPDNLDPGRRLAALAARALLCLALIAQMGLAGAAFAASSKPWVVTLAMTMPGKTTYDIYGLVMPAHLKAPIKQRGFCWSLAPSPSYPASCRQAGSGLGFYGLTLTGLFEDTTYYAQAYAIAGPEITYGNQVVFKTLPPTGPTAATSDPVVTGQTTAILGGAALEQGDAPILDRGVLWSTNPLPDHFDGSRSMGSGLGSFSGEIGGFTPGVTYHVRAYASSDVGTGFGQDKLFTAGDFALPQVTTTAPYGETDVAAISGGYVTHGGDTPVTARGVCWSTSPGPTAGGSHSRDGEGVGRFHSAITGLQPLTEYYVRAYATNDAGTSYGEEYQFKTAHPDYPTVNTQGIVAVYDVGALLGGEVVLTGDATAEERGFCWSETPQPLITDESALDDGSGAGEFQVMLNGLKPQTVYYARAYAKNQYGVFYGHIVHFKTRFSKYPAR